MSSERVIRPSLSLRSVWMATALGAYLLAIVVLGTRFWSNLASPAQATAAVSHHESLFFALAIGGLLTCSAGAAVASALTRTTTLGALSAFFLACALVVMEGSGLPEPAFTWPTGPSPAVLALLLVATDWLSWAIFQSRIRKVRVNQVFRFSGTASAILALTVCLAPPPMQWPALIVCAALTVPITTLTLIDMLAFDRPQAAPIFFASWLLCAAALALQFLDHTGLVNSLPGPAAGGMLAIGLAGFVLAALIDAHHAYRSDASTRQRSFDAARKYRHVYYSVPVALVSIDSNGQVLRWNDMADVFFQEWLTKGRLNYLSKLLGNDRMKMLLRDAATGGRHTCELRLPNDETDRVYALDALAVGGSIEISFVDISERSRLSDVLEHMAHHDFLTDKLNRRGLERHIDTTLQAVGALGQTCVIYVDLDRFKSINDVFGHAAGDAVVVEVMHRMAALVPDSGVIGRLGGDEFLVVLNQTTLEAATTLADQIMAMITGQCYLFEGTRLEIEASMGVVAASGNMTTRELIGHADDACGQSKRSGRAKITAVQTTRESLHNYRAEMYYGTQLKSNLPIDQLRLYAQPIVPLRDPLLPMSYEVLLRTQDEHGHVHAPGRLLAAAERQGAMATIDRFVLSQSIEYMAGNRDFADNLGYLAINLSGMSLNDEAFLSDAVAMINSHPGIAPSICLEITESIALYDMKNTRRFVDQMRSIGVSVALDDFGAGYTSFAYLKELPATLVKIDGQFILDIARDPKQRGIVRAIQQLAGELGMRCVAEWVEDVPTLRTLLELEIDYAQGFVLARAQPIRHWLTQDVDLTPLKKARRLQSRAINRPSAERSDGGVIARIPS